MKKTQFKLSLIAIGIIVIFALNSCANSPISGYTKFKNETIGFSIDMPEGWNILENYMGVTVASISPSDGPDDNYRENVNVFIELIRDTLSLEQYYQTNITRINQLSVDYKEIGNDDTKINDLKVKWLLYSYSMGEQEIKVLSYILIKGKFGLSINCSAVSDKFPGYQKDFEKIGHSFRFERVKIKLQIDTSKTDK